MEGASLIRTEPTLEPVRIQYYVNKYETDGTSFLLVLI